jgi:glycerol-3-phosphate O-acyltransferase/dihydroxyacetone phosphate acyltransferase
MMAGKDANTNVKASAKLRGQGAEGFQYKVLPHVDQEDTYGAVFQRLNEGGCIGIFPEGELL